MSNYKYKLSSIKAFAFDVDGVFTDGNVLVTDSGDLLRSHNAKDGFAVRMALLNGYPVAIITGGISNSILKRFYQIGIDKEDIYLDSHHKIQDFIDFCKRHSFDPEEVLFMGDDIPDIGILKECGLPTCPSDAVNEVKEVCEYISLYPGGKGCVRDVIEQVLKIQDNWNPSSEAYSG
ncbi:MAG TPA: HAD hydrolase family protein [Bacteroidales bacterium]|nr:HAD hydrolase family protein [Bacteroidales bacterium]HRR48999.1 HAD hydrolase family protein [Bacteroidales bacterium]HRT33208.1 HAD hydrolase family protein [Bacteroidales bacterium]HRT84016.1 HAD hydrolase family protein [Bacteroidales bacterium]